MFPSMLHIITPFELDCMYEPEYIIMLLSQTSTNKIEKLLLMVNLLGLGNNSIYHIHCNIIVYCMSWVFQQWQNIVLLQLNNSLIKNTIILSLEPYALKTRIRSVIF